MSQTSAVLELISKPALTITESAADYDSLVKSFEQASGFSSSSMLLRSVHSFGRVCVCVAVKWPPSIRPSVPH